MKFMLLLSALVLTGLAQMQAASKRPAANDADLKNAEQQWVNAYYSGDGATLSRLEADDFTVIANGEKPQFKKEQIASVQGRGPAGIPSPNVEETIRHYGNVAVITGLSESSHTRFTTVWVKMDGRWKVVHLHYSTEN
jgi:ketosteroid isomerase-like protein